MRLRSNLTGLRRNLLWGAILFVFIGLNISYGQNFEVAIGQVEVATCGQEIDVDVQMLHRPFKISGFDLRIAYDSRAMAVTDVTPGTSMTEYGLEYFNYGVWPSDDENVMNNQAGVLRIVAYTDNTLMPDTATQEIMADISFLLSGNRDYTNIDHPLNFYWNGCGDNILFSSAKDSLFVSDNVYDYENNPIAKDTLLPTITGMPSICERGIPDNFDKTVIRNVDFYDGKINFVCLDTIDRRGDVNLNGYILDEGDFELFVEYLIACNPQSVFTLNYADQLAAANTNGDGNPATIHDFVFMNRLKYKDTLATTQLDSVYNGTLTIKNYESYFTVAYGGEIDLGGLLLTFDDSGATIDSIVMATNSAHMDVRTEYCEDHFNTMVYTLDSGLAIPANRSGIMKVYYNGETPTLTGYSASGYYGQYISVDIQSVPIDEPAEFSFGIQTRHNVMLGHELPLLIYKTGGNGSVEGFDFLVAYNAQVITATSVEPGELIDENKYEYFTYRFGNTGDCGDDPCPSGMIRIVGMRETNDGVINDYYLTGDGQLIIINFLLSDDHQYDCTFAPVSFFWMDCGDNTIAFKDSISAPIEDIKTGFVNNVYNIMGTDTIQITNTTGGFPSYFGINDSCLDVGPEQHRLRAIDFYNGGFEIDCNEPLDERGDINLNGIAYEIADAVVFSNYFLSCNYDAFTINVEAQKAVSDVNADGLVLQIEDLQYLIQVILGNALPIPLVNPAYNATVEAYYRDGAIEVSMNAPLDIGAVTASFYMPGADLSSIEPATDINMMDFGYEVCLDTLKILIESFENDHYISSGENDLFQIHYSGDRPEAVMADVAGYNGERVDTDLEETFPPIPEIPYSIGIETVDSVGLNKHTYVDVTKYGGSYDLLGFDLLMGYDTDGLTFIGASTDLTEIPGDYEWEYLTYRYTWNGDCGENCPTGLARVVGIAETNDGAHHPLEVNIPDGKSLFTLDFIVSSNMDYDCQFLPIRFYWQDCGDNTIAYQTDTSEAVITALADNVYDVIDGDTILISDTTTDFPTYYGAKDTCFTQPVGQPAPVRFINFYNGGVQVACSHQECDCHGDVNLNGTTAELEDILIYRDYFVYGLDAFTIDQPRQLCCTEVNGDGVYPTIEDFVYMTRVYTGDAYPLPSDTVFDCDMVWENGGDQIKVSTFCDLAMGAVTLSFNMGETTEIDTVILADDAFGMQVMYDIHNDKFNIILYSTEMNTFLAMGENDLFTIKYSGDRPDLVAADAAEYYGERIDVDISYIEPFAFTIETVPNARLGYHTYFDITKTAGTEELSYFEFYIAYDASALTFVGAISDELTDAAGDYRWEYFNYRYKWNGAAGDDEASGLVFLSAFANLDDGNEFTGSTDLENGTLMASLDFMVTTDMIYNCRFIPLRFYWQDCEDNHISFRYRADEDTLNLKSGIDRKVFEDVDGEYVNITDSTASELSYFGAQDFCLGDGTMDHHPIERFVDFYGGGVQIECVEQDTLIGDLNLNGVANEIADAVIFSNYFRYGLDAFTLDVDLQTAVSDVNGDGYPLMLSDLIYLNHTIIGDPLPELGPSIPCDLLIRQGDTNCIVLSSCDIDITEMFMIFVLPDTTQPVVVDYSYSGIDVEYHRHLDTLRLLVRGENNSAITAGSNQLFELIHPTGHPDLVYVDAAGTNGEIIDLTPVYESIYGATASTNGLQPMEFKLYQNSPNPFNPDTRIQFDLPYQSEWKVEIFDITGRRVGNYEGNNPAGTVVIEWNSRDSNGVQLPTGIYLYRLRAGDFVDSRKMILMK